jgi:hypothetical protein
MRAEVFLNLPESEAVDECIPPTCANFEYYFERVFGSGIYDSDKRHFTVSYHGNRPVAARFFAARVEGMKFMIPGAGESIPVVALVKNPDRDIQRVVGERNALISYNGITFACSIGRGGMNVDRAVLKVYKNLPYQEEFCRNLEKYTFGIDPRTLEPFKQ